MKVLIVVDMQNDFIDGALGTKEAQLIVPKVAEKIRNFQGAVVYTRDTHFDNYMETQEGRMLPVVHCIKGTAGHQLQADILKACEEKDAAGMDKVTFGAKDLPELLQSICPDGPESIELAGLCTDICVISNAMLLKAFFPESPVSVDASCCAGVTPDSHKNALEAMKMCQIAVTNEDHNAKDF